MCAAAAGRTDSQAGRRRLHSGGKRRTPIGDKTFTYVAQLTSFFSCAMFKNAFTGFKAQIQAVEPPVMLFQHVHHSQGLKVVFKTSMLFHAFVQRVLPRRAERSVSKVMSERDGLHQILVKT